MRCEFNQLVLDTEEAISIALNETIFSGDEAINK